MKYYRTGWISDVHLGTRGSKASDLLNFLRETEFETLYIVGDLIDIWALRRATYWPQEHNDVVQKLLRKGRKGTEIVYIIGNHDEFLGRFQGNYGSMTLQRNAVHRTADGRRLLVMHGDELDTVVQNLGWLAHLGDIGYRLLLRCNGAVNFVRRSLGLGYWSLSAYVKAEVKNVVSFIGQFEEAIVRYARDFDVDGVLCGHIHTAAIREIQGVTYYNAGDWVESCTAIVERYDGRMELLHLGETMAETAIVEGPRGPVPASSDEPKGAEVTYQEGGTRAALLGKTTPAKGVYDGLEKLTPES